MSTKPGQHQCELAKEAGVVRSYFTRVFRLSFLAPDITKAIMSNRHLRDLTARQLSVTTKLEHAWPDQIKQFKIR